MSDTKESLLVSEVPKVAAALGSARSVIETEIAGLKDLLLALDARFVTAVELLGKVRGRVIVTGMGKSGHIARKTAATLASTGTPAQYIISRGQPRRPGMITAEDALIALSNWKDRRAL